MLGISAVPASVAPALAAAGPRTPLSRGPQTCRAPLLWLSPPPYFSIHSSEMPVPKPPASKSATMRPPHPPAPPPLPRPSSPPHPFLPPLSLSLSHLSPPSSYGSLTCTVQAFFSTPVSLSASRSFFRLTLPHKWSKFSFFLGTLSKALLSEVLS